MYFYLWDIQTNKLIKMADSNTLSVIFFLIPTILYYIYKPTPTYMLEKEGADVNGGGAKEHYKNRNKYLAIYIGVVVLIQIAMSIWTISSKCGAGNLGTNIGIAALTTLLPWLLIFGTMVSTLMIFPGFKSVFSNVYGYFAVAGKANDILSKLLVNMELEDQLAKEGGNDNTQHQGLRRAAESIVKLTGNKSILINQIVPENFNEYWNMLTPLMKQGMAGVDIDNLKKQLFDLTILRDNIGEAFWYIYTAILLIFIIQYNIATRGCVKTPETLADSLNSYREETQSAVDKKAKLDSQLYVG